jgi:hypothetical protein
MKIIMKRRHKTPFIKRVLIRTSAVLQKFNNNNKIRFFLLILGLINLKIGLNLDIQTLVQFTSPLAKTFLTSAEVQFLCQVFYLSISFLDLIISMFYPLTPPVINLIIFLFSLGLAFIQVKIAWAIFLCKPVPFETELITIINAKYRNYDAYITRSEHVYRILGRMIKEQLLSPVIITICVCTGLLIIIFIWHVITTLLQLLVQYIFYKERFMHDIEEYMKLNKLESSLIMELKEFKELERSIFAKRPWTQADAKKHKEILNLIKDVEEQLVRCRQLRREKYTRK